MRRVQGMFRNTKVELGKGGLIKNIKTIVFLTWRNQKPDLLIEGRVKKSEKEI